MEAHRVALPLLRRARLGRVQLRTPGAAKPPLPLNRRPGTPSGMIIHLATALTLATNALQPVAAQDRPPREQAPPSRLTTREVSGRYKYRDKELIGHIDLRADGTFEYKVDGIGPPVEGEAPFHLLMRGVWRLSGYDGIALTNPPTSPPTFEQTSAVRDPTVRAAFTVTASDGEPTSDLGLLTDDGENGELNMLSDGKWTVPLYDEWGGADGKATRRVPKAMPRSWRIVRLGDDLPLLRVDLSPNGPNRFAFSYTRSPIEPFRLAARPVEGEPGMIEVEFGSASIKMRRAAP